VATSTEEYEFRPSWNPFTCRLSNNCTVGGKDASSRKGKYARNRPQGIQVIQGQINGFDHFAIPDTGAEFNIMAKAFAKSRGFLIDNEEPSKCRLLRMASGKHIKTIGVVEATWCFSSDSSHPLKIIFHVLTDFVYDLILGSHFLFATKTMSHHKERLSRIPRPLDSLFVLRVNILGSASRQVEGVLQDQSVKALPDSGSEPSLLSYEYVKRRGWLMKMKMEDQNLLQFADGSVEKTEGSIPATWYFPTKDGSSDPEISLRIEFHILRGCSHDIILGQDVLEETDMFLEHEDAFLDIKSDTEASGLNLVIWLPRKKKPIPSVPSVPQAQPPRRQEAREYRTPRYRPPTPPPNSYNERRVYTSTTVQHDPLHVELQRRAAVDRHIKRMPPGLVKDIALATERVTRDRYDSHTPAGRAYQTPANSGNRTGQVRETGYYHPSAFERPSYPAGIKRSVTFGKPKPTASPRARSSEPQPTTSSARPGPRSPYENAYYIPPTSMRRLSGSSTSSSSSLDVSITINEGSTETPASSIRSSDSRDSRRRRRRRDLSPQRGDR